MPLNAISPAQGHLTQLRQDGLLYRSTAKVEVDPDGIKALNQVKGSTQRVLGTGIAGEQVKEATSTLANIERISRLSEGDINAVNLKAAVDLGQQVVGDGQMQQLLGRIGTPLAALASAEGFSNSLERTLDNPTPHNMKSLLGSTRGITSSATQISLMLAEHTGSAGSILVRGSQTLNKISPVVNTGIAVMDVAIAGSDIKTFWEDSSLKNGAKMTLGLVAAGASVLHLAKLPVFGVNAAIVAVVADVAKLGLDIDWAKVGKGAQGIVHSKAVEASQAMQAQISNPKPVVSGSIHFGAIGASTPMLGLANN